MSYVLPYRRQSRRHAFRHTSRVALEVALIVCTGSWPAALGQAAMDAVQGALHRHLRGRHRVLRALRTTKFRKAEALAVATPTVARARAWAGLQGAIDATIPGLAPARTVQACAVAGAVAKALRHRAIATAPLWGTLALPCHACSTTIALVRACGELAVVARPACVALAAQANAFAIRCAVVRASQSRAVAANPPRLAVARAIVAVAMIATSMGARLERAVDTGPAGLARASECLVAPTVSGAAVGASALLASVTRVAGSTLAGTTGREKAIIRSTSQ